MYKHEEHVGKQGEGAVVPLLFHVLRALILFFVLPVCTNFQRVLRGADMTTNLVPAKKHRRYEKKKRLQAVEECLAEGYNTSFNVQSLCPCALLQILSSDTIAVIKECQTLRNVQPT